MSSKTPDQQFTFYVKLSTLAFVLCFGYFVIADMHMPMTPQARVYHSVTQVAPRVSGTIERVYVQNSQSVQAGDPLFEIDAKPYQLALEKARLSLDDVIQQNRQLDAQISATQAKLLASEADLKESRSEYQRSQSLAGSKAISIQQLDKNEARFLAAEANVQALKAELEVRRIARGKRGEDNLALMQAKNALRTAQLNLDYTRVTAAHDGVITNMQVTPGTFAVTGTPLTSLVEKRMDLVADFREKSLGGVSEDMKARVVFDAFPGKVFSASVSEFEAGIADGQIAANGQLAQVERSDRWVRDAQRQRLHLDLDTSDPQLHRLTSGARATVQVVPDNRLTGFLAKLQIYIVSYLHYIY